ncbi:MAG: arsenite methyltransferase [Catalinimonas sp.]
MNKEEEIKQMVRDRYEQVALQDRAANAASCCGTTDVSQEVYNIMTDDYREVAGYQPDADLGLGCGLPTAFARIEPGNWVLDLGSGAGNDCFVARHETGETGRVIGVDFAPTMLQKARANADRLGFNNVEFRLGDLDDLPVTTDSIDVVVSNCVLNLVPDKPRVMAEMFRVLRPGGHFSVSDVVLVGDLPPALQKDAEMYAGCVSGAAQKGDYLDYLREAGFQNLNIQKQKPIVIPDDILRRYLSDEQIAAFRAGQTGIFSVTVWGEKPDGRQAAARTVATSTACTPGGGCC